MHWTFEKEVKPNIFLLTCNVDHWSPPLTVKFHVKLKQVLSNLFLGLMRTHHALQMFVFTMGDFSSSFKRAFVSFGIYIFPFPFLGFELRQTIGNCSFRRKWVCYLSPLYDLTCINYFSNAITLITLILICASMFFEKKLSVREQIMLKLDFFPESFLPTMNWFGWN